MMYKPMHAMALVMMLAVLCACGTVPTTTSSDNPVVSANPSSPPAASPTSAESTTAASTVRAVGGEQIETVATTSIIADLVRNVGGERVQVQALLSPGSDPHAFTPTPGDVQAIAEADIVFENGLGLETWLAEVIENAGGERPVVAVSNGITPIEGGEHDDEHGDEHAETAMADAEHMEATTEASGAAAHDHTNDPHMWFDVQHTIRYVENIRDGLQTIDPAGATTYDQNAAAYIEQLQQLDADVAALVEQIPAERRKLITNHDTFAYFAERYGFAVIGTVFANVSTEQEPSAQQIAALVERIREENVPAVFTENTVNTRLAEQVAAEAGVQVVTDLYTDALGEAGSAGDTFVKMMRHNVEQIVAALR